MIKAGSLVEFVPTVCIESGENVTIHTVYHRFLDYAKKTKLPAVFYKDTVVSGNWFQKTREDCLVIHHPNQKLHYTKLCIRVKHLGTKAFVYISFSGNSVQMTKAAKAEIHRKAGRVFLAALLSFGHNRAKYEEEQMYYECFRQMCGTLTSRN